MSISSSAHIHDDTVIVAHGEGPVGGRGYLRIEFDDERAFPSLSIHGSAVEMRRLGFAALRLAAELDPPAKTYRDDFANSLALASYGRMADREDECPRMGENR